MRRLRPLLSNPLHRLIKPQKASKSLKERTHHPHPPHTPKPRRLVPAQPSPRHMHRLGDMDQEHQEQPLEVEARAERRERREGGE
jgi:hypothetical protein